MKRGRLPLTALRSFEVAGRLESFTLAAAELFVSQAAISRQVRELEDLIGRPLFERHHRSVRLTADGRALLGTLTAAFDTVGESLDALSGRQLSQTLKVSAEPSFAGCWLVPHLQQFQQENPDIDLVIDADTRLVEFRSGDADIAIRHSVTARSWPRVEARPLAKVEMVPMIAPALAAAGKPLDRPEDLLQHGLLHEENRQLWEQWFAGAGEAPVKLERGAIFADGSMVLQATLRGNGVGLIDRDHARDDIAAGRLIQPFDISVPYGALFIVTRRFDALSEAALAFVAWVERSYPGAGRER
ncbi:MULTISPECIES: LysR substrate-binding domain-containing protein [unclassified Ensifer]|uniref:LysR substrate-binding domain-containing protein n=1 Tax=unclassified Ensifer TaxID=2633371 RepID=UPI000812F049|nr:MULTISPECIES: LysR substrate-binding domain-containing protein [unclassified Ensifer]OCP01687.1 transcriptional regulator [Ensifer sp. LC14]OCP09475.1 transcriptional regulator [Ensifer sp. LC13]OCP10649.1 transcriptional regulator [Ensifer sp. LC11]OCP32723.1 transcriptional regulator [Ensifer sp. LC499]